MTDSKAVIQINLIIHGRPISSKIVSVWQPWTWNQLWRNPSNIWTVRWINEKSYLLQALSGEVGGLPKYLEFILAPSKSYQDVSWKKKKKKLDRINLLTQEKWIAKGQSQLLVLWGTMSHHAKPSHSCLDILDRPSCGSSPAKVISSLWLILVCCGASPPYGATVVNRLHSWGFYTAADKVQLILGGDQSVDCEKWMIPCTSWATVASSLILHTRNECIPASITFSSLWTVKIFHTFF